MDGYRRIQLTGQVAVFMQSSFADGEREVQVEVEVMGVVSLVMFSVEFRRWVLRTRT